MPEFHSFEEFWPYYVSEHSKKSTRRWHFVGTSLAGAALLGGLFTKRRWLLAAAPLLGYGPAWIGHFFFEGNKPATFHWPLWSLRADFVMFAKMLGGTMDDEVARVMAERAAVEANGANGDGGHAHAVGSDVDEAAHDDPSLN